MCGRYTLLADEMKINNRFSIDNRIQDYRPSYNIAPGQNVLALIADGNERRAGYLRWGLVPSWAKDEKIGYKMINARSETVHEKPSFKQLLTRKRCLVIADSFYEWSSEDKTIKTPLRISVKDSQLFAFAALWDKWQVDEHILFTTTLLTKSSNKFMQQIHHRMPIILPKEEEETWLSAKFSKPIDVQQYLEGLSDPVLSAYKVSSYVNSVKNNDENCIALLKN